MYFKTIDNISLEGKKAVVRADLNVPMNGNEVIDTLRIDRLLPTLEKLIERKAKVIVISHFGRPGGIVNKKFSLEPLRKIIAKKLNIKLVHFSKDCIGSDVSETVKNLNDGELILLENLRFYKEEELNDKDFAYKLSQLGDLFINEAFSCSHRSHASTVGITEYLPSFAGYGTANEIDILNNILDKPSLPLATIIGGSKISSKINTILNLIDKVDTLIIGGGMANTFLYAKNIEIGNSIYEKNMVETAKKILIYAKEKNREIMLPIDAVVAKKLGANEKTSTYSINSLPDDQMVLDIGPKTIELLIQKISKCKSLVWNGPLGAFEIKPFDIGTKKIAEAVASLSKQNQLLSVAGGGDTIASLSTSQKHFSYVSTAGGAFLEWLEGKKLPGIEALERNNLRF
tara:strand:- start:624 stop:1826 length:1203 start_codon:yes stop_codon:yes gene_type:complete